MPDQTQPAIGTEYSPLSSFGIFDFAKDMLRQSGWGKIEQVTPDDRMSSTEGNNVSAQKLDAFGLNIVANGNLTDVNIAGWDEIVIEYLASSFTAALAFQLSYELAPTVFQQIGYVDLTGAAGAVVSGKSCAIDVGRFRYFLHIPAGAVTARVVVSGFAAGSADIYAYLKRCW